MLFGNKALNKFLCLSAGLDIKVSEYRKDNRADKVDKKVVHRVDDSHIKITAEIHHILTAVRRRTVYHKVLAGQNNVVDSAYYFGRIYTRRIKVYA